MLDGIETIEQVVHPSYKDLESFDFQSLLDKNLYTNLNSVHFVFPLQIRKASNEASAIDSTLITVNNFFGHWVKEISVTKYGTNKELTPTTTPQEIYQDSDSMLKYLPKKSLVVIRNGFLFSEKDVNYPNGKDRRVHSLTINTAERTDNNLDDRTAKFANQIKNKYVYRIPLKYICDIGKINFPQKIDTKICLTSETDMKKLFE